MMANKDYVKYGSEWPEHEDYLVGNRDGLVKLLSSIQQSLDSEEGVSELDAGDFVGVKVLNTHWFETIEPETSCLTQAIFISALIALAFTLIVGIGTIIYWFTLI